ncbi:hypothetical protein N7478_000166 [Penicillium angulare]|uniref:uncharacterized protein n=1 Tax=Penicillium angulare TaxID=116970 RepID=UPI002541B6E7|nr:uncharacterized protein N7478_000166 [Penicillium angulare]KAJ5290915.1 hypothetical protein N7478_000166 [Penicillium angulare]
MRVIAALGLAALTSMVSARPHAHGHHHAHQERDVQERDVVVDWVTKVEWVTVTDEVSPPPAPTTSAEPTTTTTSAEVTPTSLAIQQAEIQIPSSSSSSSSSTSSSSSVATVQPTPIVTPTWTTSSSVVPSSTSDVIETATATGGSGVKIENNLGQTIYMWATSNLAGEMDTIADGESYTETWQINPDGGGISIKLGTTSEELSVLQFEYTKEDETIWWDMSSINLDKTSLFVQKGFSVTSNDASCSTVTCDAGNEDCSESYQHPNDVDTRSCTSTAAFTLKLGV